MSYIIVATDFSAEADNAMIYAAKAAAEVGFSIVLFQLFKPNIHALNARSESSSLKENALAHQKKLNKAAYHLEQEYNVPTVAAELGTDEFSIELKKCIDKYDAQMVIIGMAEKSLEQDLIGNTTTKTLHSNKIPTVAIPIDAKYGGIKQILFACDIMRGVHKLVLDKIKAMAQLFKAKVEVMYVSKTIQELNNEKANTTMNDLKDGAEHIEFYYKNVQSSQIVRAIEQEIDEINADLLVMVPYKYGFWSSIVHRSITGEMASGNKIPLFSIPL